MEAQSSNAKVGKSSSTPISGIALALTAFLYCTFLVLDPHYFGDFTSLAAVILLFIGIAGMGFELDKLITWDRERLLHEAQISGVFGNLGMGMALTVVWAYAYEQLHSLTANVALAVVLLLGLWGMTMAATNLLFITLPGTPAAGVPKAGQTVQGSIRPLSVATRLAVGIVTLTAFVAAFLQILQILKVLK